ncbi:unnamed protein product [Linum tenue]|uniref:Late embryogenesis abundant protein LEA-2 subgroup domain-containing protein n=1 Tax=Linum tenue TaxID=586396 RepID=A0AAV0MI12_9ROSI|nr:unnamed protein product [Linum tenue]
MAAMLFLILLFTAFRIKVPHIAVARVTSAGPQTLNRLRNRTATVLADVKVRNPNAAAFRFGGGEATVYYGETVVGEAATPPGEGEGEGDGPYERGGRDFGGEVIRCVAAHGGR